MSICLLPAHCLEEHGAGRNGIHQGLFLLGLTCQGKGKSSTLSMQRLNGSCVHDTTWAGRHDIQ